MTYQVKSDRYNRNAITHRAQLRCGLSVAALALATLGLSQPAAAQAPRPTNLVSACSGVSLPRSAITDTIRPVVNGVVSPIEGDVNRLLTVLGLNLDIDTTTLLNDAAAGQPITLQVLNRNGTVVGASDRCDTISDSLSLNTPAGIAIGGNRITGLGTTGQDALSGEQASIAFGNNATTAASAVGSIAVGAGAAIGANATGSVALGAGADVSAANSVALGAGSTAGRGAFSNYTALGLAAPQNSVGEVSIGSAAGARQLTNVSAGSATTDAVNVGQLQGVADSLNSLANLAVTYDDASRSAVTLGGVAGTTITNVAPGALNAGSTDAVNGSQLYATNQDVANNRTDIDQNTTNIVNNRTDINQNTTKIANNLKDINRNTNNIAGNRTDINHNTTDIENNRADINNNTANIANDRTDINKNTVNIASNTTSINTINSQITDINNGAVGAVRYSNGDDPTTPNGGTPTNDATLVGADPGPVGLHNVASGAVAAGSTDAVNGSQLNATNQTVATVQNTANTALTLSQNSVQYDDASHSAVTLGNSGSAAVALHNVAAGSAETDAVNVAQVNQGLQNTLDRANAYTNAQLAGVNYDIGKLRDDAQAGTASALAVAGLPQAFEAGRGLIAFGVGTYRGESAFALGVSKALPDDHTVFKLGAAVDTRGYLGANGGVGYQF